MKRPLSHPVRLVCVLLLICALLSCGLTAFAAEEGSTDTPATEIPAITAEPSTGSADAEITSEPETTAAPLPPYPEDMKDELYPADVQTVIEEGTRRIVKTYILTANESPADIPRADFERDGWLYTLTDITQKKTSGTDTRAHTETVEINTDSNDLNKIIALLSPTLEYESEDGYCGLITLDLASVKCEAAGYKNSSYTITATREYPHLSSNDLSLIPKTITDNGRTLELDSVSWETQHSTNIDYQEIPDSYRAIVKYTAKASKSVVTGYITTADYSGEIAKAYTGDTVYTAYFSGAEINPTPAPVEPSTPPETEPTTTPEQSYPTPFPVPDRESGSIPIVPVIIAALIAALLAGGTVFLFLRHNVKVYVVGDRGRIFVAKVRISVKNPVIDLTPLDGRSESKCFNLEIDKFAAKSLNGKTVDVIFGPARLSHKIAYEGSVYRIEADFHSMTIKALY